MSLLDPLIRPRDRDHPHRRVRAQVILVAPLLIAFWGPIFATIFVSIGSVPQSVAVMITAAMLAITPVVYVRTASNFWSSSVLLGSLLFGIGSIAFLGGGLYSPAMAWTLLVPMVAVYLVGPRWSAVWVALMAAQFLLANTEVYRSLQLEAPIPAWLHVASLAALGVAAASVTTLFHHSTRKMENGLSARTAELEEALEDLDGARWRLQEEAEQRADAERYLASARKMEALGQLAAGVAHEINTPVQFVGDTLHFLQEAHTDHRELIHDLTELIAREAPALLDEVRALQDRRDLPFYDTEVSQAYARGDDGLQRVTRIVRAMHEFAHPTTMERADGDLEHALRSTALMADHTVRHVADVEFDFQGVPVVPCFIDELIQVFVNLMVNAAHAIETRQQRGRRARGRIVVSTAVEGPWVVVRIADDGGGIPEHLQHRVFDPFFTTKPIGRGTGQGLALAHAVVEKHGGTIQVQSTPGEGTTFSIHLPRAVQEAA